MQQNDGSTDLFSGIVRDKNGESDLQGLRIRTLSGPTVLSERILVAADLNQQTEPAAFDAQGWKVWTPTARQGEVWFRFQFTYPAGQGATYQWEASVKDEDPYSAGPAGPITVEVRIRLDVASGPVEAGGQAAPAGTAWGGWAADPGQKNVSSANYARVTNTGFTATQSLTIDFTASEFTGSPDPNYTVPIDGNIRFAGWEDATPATTSPAEGTYGFGAISTTGSATISFTAVGNVIYVAYRLDALPAVLLDQSYQASYVVVPA